MPSPEVLIQVRKRIDELNAEAQRLAQAWQEISNQRDRYQIFLDVWGELNPTTTVDGEETPLIQELRGHQISDAAEIVMERTGGQVSL